MIKIFNVRTLDEADANQLEDTPLKSGFEFQVHNSAPVELYPVHPTPLLWHDDRVVVRGIHKNGEFHVYVHRAVDGVERLPRGYMEGSGSLNFKINR